MDGADVFNLHLRLTTVGLAAGLATEARAVEASGAAVAAPGSRTIRREPAAGAGCPPPCRDVQPALVISRHYVTERDSAPVQYNDVV